MIVQSLLDRFRFSSAIRIPTEAPPYDYTPLAQPERRFRLKVIAVTVLIMLSLFFVWYSAAPALTVLLIAIVVLSQDVARANNSRRLRREQMISDAVKEFVERNSLEPTMAMIPPALLGINGRARGDARNAYEFKLKNTLCRVCDFEYELYDGKSTKQYRFGVAYMPNPMSYPHLFLDGMQNGSSDAYKQSQRLSLEGDFDKYFNLYAPEHEVVDVLSIIAPDVMQTLIDGGRPYDIEIIGNAVFVITKETAFTIDRLPTLLTFCQELMRELNERNLSWQPLKLSAQNWRRDLLYRNKVFSYGIIGLALSLAVVYFVVLSVES